MKTRIASILAALAGLAVAVSLWAVVDATPAPAALLPGMCNGPSTPNLGVIAHANGTPNAVPKFILNVSTDASGAATGSLVLGRGPDRLLVTDWCRVWRHDPAQSEGGMCGEPYPAGADTAHAVGLTTEAGRRLIVRTDVRRLSDGRMLFRVRYRAWAGEETQATEGDSCDDEAWTRVPAEGWYPLDQLQVRSTVANG